MIEIELTDDEYGQRGGWYYFLENEYNKLIRIADLGKKEETVGGGRGNSITYRIKCSENSKIYLCAFTSNPNNRSFHVYVYNAKDFLHVEHERPESIRDYEPIEIRDKFQISTKLQNAIIEYKNLQPLIKNLTDRTPRDWLSASPATKEAIKNPSNFLVSICAMSKQGSVPKSLMNIVKYFKQLYEIKAIVDGFDAKIEKLDVSRSGSYFPYRAPNLDTLPLDVLDFLQITFSNPNIMIRTEDDYYTIWYEFSLARDIRPDFFILKGKHETPFKEEVYDFLSTMDRDFGISIIEQWHTGCIEFIQPMSDNSTHGKKDNIKEEMGQFIVQLAKFLKPGIIIESKESVTDYRTKTTHRQLERYHKIFGHLNLLLLSWTKVPSYISGFNVIDNFNINVESTKRLTNYIKEVLE